MKKLAKEVFTENDNETFCLARVSWGAGFIAICTLAGATVITGGVVSVVELAIALSTIAAGHGAAIKLKS